MSVINNFVSLKTVIEKVFRTTGYTNELDYADTIEWAGEAMDLIGAKVLYIEKVTNGTCPSPCPNPEPIIIENYRGELPCDLHRLIQARENTTKIPMRYSGNNFHMFADQDVPLTPYVNNNMFTYKIQGNYIFTSFKTGAVELAYIAFPTDDEGMPMIPNDTKVQLALASYIIERIDYKLWRQNKIAGPVYQSSQKEWCFRVAQCNTHLALPTLDEMESIKNQWCRLIPKVNRHADGFNFLGTSERIYNKNSL